MQFPLRMKQKTNEQTNNKQTTNEETLIPWIDLENFKFSETRGNLAFHVTALSNMFT